MEMQTTQTPVPDPADMVLTQAEARWDCRIRWLIAAGIVSLIVGYPLSFIPLLILRAYGFMPDALMNMVYVVYSPVTYAVNNIPLVNDLFELCFQCLGITL